MVEVKKNKGPQEKPEEGSTSNELNIHVNNPLYINANDTNGTSLLTFKLSGIENYKVWSVVVTLALHTKKKLGFINELEETYNNVDGSVIFNQHYKIHSLTQSGSSLSGSIRLMQFLMGLDDTYGPVRSLIMTNKPLHDVKCYELVRYPPGFKKKGNNQSVNNVNTNKVDKSEGITHTFTSDQYKRLMNLLSGPGLNLKVPDGDW
nr:hypothetical protein [Tanacetum cinerariifolium]